MRRSYDSLSPTLPDPLFGSGLTQRVVLQSNLQDPVDNPYLARVQFRCSQGLDIPGNYACELPLIAPPNSCEDWLFSPGLVQHGSCGEIVWSSSGVFTFAATRQQFVSDTDILSQTRASYRALLAFVTQSSHPFLLRCWNYIPHINRGAGDNEIYKRFCSGRLQAFQHAGLSEEKFPSASAVGHSGKYLTIQVLSAAIDGVHHGNKNQVHAFRYPRQYGSSSPSFARATSVNVNGAKLLFISGTASIVGHSTCYPNEIRGQLQVTVENIRQLLAQNGKVEADVVCMRVYLRKPADYQAAYTALLSAFGDVEKTFVQADICRSDLLVEVECFCS